MTFLPYDPSPCDPGHAGPAGIIGAEGGQPLSSHRSSQAAVAQRSASDVVRFVDSLKQVGLGRDAEKVYDNMQRRGVRHLLALVYVLLQERRHHDTWALLLRAAQTRPGHEIAALITNFYEAGRHQYAAELLILTVRSRAASEVRALIGVLDGLAPGSQTIVRIAARNSQPRDTATLLTWLERRGLHAHAEVVFHHTLNDQSVRHLGEFLSALAEARSSYVDQVALCERATAASTSAAARLLLALDSTSLIERLAAMVDTLSKERSAQDVTRLVIDLETLDSPLKPLSWSVVQRLLRNVVRTRSTTDQAAMACAFEVTDRSRYAEYLISKAEAMHGRRFKDELRKERGRYERKGLPLTLAFPLGVPAP
nr:hypothetical protein OG999_29955 [Streptomyces sp. NBC_00886]